MREIQLRLRLLLQHLLHSPAKKPNRGTKWRKGASWNSSATMNAARASGFWPMGNPAMQRSIWGPRKNRRTFRAIFAAPTRSRRSNSPEKNLKLQSPLKQQPGRTPLLERRPALAPELEPEQVAGGRKAPSSRRSCKVDQAAFGFFHFELIHLPIRFLFVLTAGRFKPTASRPSTD